VLSGNLILIAKDDRHVEQALFNACFLDQGRLFYDFYRLSLIEFMAVNTAPAFS
jgi:hypothetical protein